jgi:glutamyl-tRNA reductase
MHLISLGLNHKTAPVAVRERFSLSKAVIRQGLESLGEYEGVEEAVVLSTCNRSEIYAVVEEAAQGFQEVRQFLADLTGNTDSIEAYCYRFEDEACIRHLFFVAASLDSLVIGEGQILSQVKEAYAIARAAHATSTVLNTLFHHAIATGKRVRTETRIQYNSVSVSYAAVKLAKEKLGGLEGRQALIFGAGRMAHLTAQHLAAQGVAKIYVANHHFSKAKELAEAIGSLAEPIRWEGALRTASAADVVVTSTGAPHYVVKPWETKQFMTRRQGRPVFLIDIAVPRDVDPEVGEIPGVTLYNIDALEEVVDEHKAERRTEAKAAERIVEEEIESLVERFQYLSLRPLMAQLSDRCERIRKRELRRVRPKLPELTKPEWRRVSHMTRMIVRKILRQPMMRLNASAGTQEEAYYREAVRALFRLDTMGDETK